MTVLRFADDVSVAVHEQDGLVLRDGIQILQLPGAASALHHIAGLMSTPRDERSLRAALPQSTGALLDMLLDHAVVVTNPLCDHLADLHQKTIVASDELTGPTVADTNYLVREAGAGPSISLQPPNLGDARLHDVLRSRRTERNFVPESVPLATIATLLGSSTGAADTIRPAATGDANAGRAYPSGGALYPIETQLLPLRVDEIAYGRTYRYQPLTQTLTRCGRVPAPDGLAQWFKGHVIEDMAALVLLSMDFSRPSLGRYGGKAYRLALLEAGHLAQNLMHVGTALGLGSLPICGFDDEGLARAVGLAYPFEVVVYAIGFGRPAAREDVDDS